MEYPALVLRHFREPRNVGPAAAGPACRGEAGSAARGTRVVFEAEVAAGRVRRLSFRAYGCPYVIAACSRVTELLADAPVAALARFDPAELAAELELPPEKLGSLLVVQDALRNCAADWDTTQPAGAL
jgi:NifU-like protein involved in Fe-S cluster formation